MTTQIRDDSREMFIYRFSTEVSWKMPAMYEIPSFPGMSITPVQSGIIQKTFTSLHELQNHTIFSILKIFTTAEISGCAPICLVAKSVFNVSDLQIKSI